MTHDTLNAWLDHIQQLHPQEIDLGLDRLRRVAQHLGLTTPAPRVITVSGTNGKGSHVAAIDAILRALGYRLGTYTSPHLLHYNERICLNGQPVSDALLIDAFERIEHARQDISLSFFEFGTLAALWIFQQQDLDAVVLEVGLGGRLDAVNLIDADVAVVSSIGLDHQDWLGDTREAIAGEKAGIFRPGKPVICTENDPPANLLEQAKALDCPLYLRGRDFDCVSGGCDSLLWSWHGKTQQGKTLRLNDLPLPALGLANVAGALQAVALLEVLPGRALLEDRQQVLGSVIGALKLPGRLQWASSARSAAPVLLDVSHNAQAASVLASELSAWRRLHGGGRIHLLLAMMQDKDPVAYYQVLEKQVDFWYIAHFDLPRAMPAGELLQILQASAPGMTGFSQWSTVPEAFAQVCRQAARGDLIVVSGSFITVSEVLQLLAAEDHTDRQDQEACSP